MDIINLGSIRKHPKAMCEECPLSHKFIKCAQSVGPLTAPIAVVGEAPGVDEILARPPQPFVGTSGQLMKGTLRQVGIDPKNVWYSNAILCRPPDNKMEGYEKALECCKPRLEWELNQLPEATKILAVGKYAAESVTQLVEGNRARKITITRQHGEWHFPAGSVAGGKVHKDVLLSVHPAYVLRAPQVMPDFIHDVRKLIEAEPEHPLQTAPVPLLVGSLIELQAALAGIPDDSWVAFDIETSQLGWYDRPSEDGEEILMLGIAANTKETIVVDGAVLRDDSVKHELNAFFKRVRTTAHNGKFDLLFLHRDGISDARVDFDTMLAHYILRETPPHDLKSLGMSKYGIANYEEEFVNKYFTNKKVQKFTVVPKEKMAAYLAWDCAVTWQLHKDFDTDLHREGLYEWPFMQVIMPAHEALLQVEKNGMAIDQKFLEAVEREMEVALTHSLVNCRDVAKDSRFNPMSYQQVGRILFDQLGYKQANPKYHPVRSTSVQAIKDIASRQPTINTEPILVAVLEYRRINKMLGTYVKPMGSWVDVGGRIHPSYKIHAAETGRLSAEKPPIQTLPRPGRDRYGDMIRASVIAGPAHSQTGRKRKLVFADYSQAELRVAAHFTQDPFLLGVYREGRDLHSEAAKRLFGEGYTKEQRVYCKNFNFAWFYGGNEYSFANQVNLPIEEAKALVQEYERLMPVATQWRKDQMALAVRQGYVDTPFGRRRRFPLITKETLQDVERASINMPIQSTASDLNLLAAVGMVRLRRKVVLSMHDATCVECWEDQTEEVAAELSRVMVGLGETYIPTVPWVVEVDVGDRWSPKVDVDDASVIDFAELEVEVDYA